MNWARELVSETFIKTNISKANQILASEINVNGKYPVIDQGQSYIAGYSDAEEKVVNDELPYVIFGDHTRIIKYVDFPFIIGADGTKVLKPKSEYNTKFYYYALLSLNIPNRGYNRHFAVLKEKFIPKPSLPEQQKIAAVLSTVQRAIELQNELIERTTELKKSMMHKLFTEGVKGERQKETEIGMVPECWEVEESSSVIDFFGGYAFKSEEGIQESNTQLIRMGNLYQNKLDLSRSPIFYPDDYAITYKRYVLSKGDLIISLTGTTGKEDYGFTVEIGECNKNLLLNQRVARIDLKSDKVIKGYILYYLLSRKYLDLLYKTAKGTKQANLSTNTMKKIPIAYPKDIDEQKQIKTAFRMIDQKINSHLIKKNKLEELFRTMLHQLMTAKVRVDGLTFDTQSMFE